MLFDVSLVQRVLRRVAVGSQHHRKGRESAQSVQAIFRNRQDCALESDALAKVIECGFHVGITHIELGI